MFKLISIVSSFEFSLIGLDFLLFIRVSFCCSFLFLLIFFLIFRSKTGD